MITKFEPARPHSVTSYEVGKGDVTAIVPENGGTTVRFVNGTALTFRPEGTQWVAPTPTAAPALAPQQSGRRR